MAVAVAVPSLGDVSYAMVRVRLEPRERLIMPAGLAARPEHLLRAAWGLGDTCTVVMAAAKNVGALID